MARPTRIQDDEILAAAREVFLELGPSAPSAEIARRAGISEGSIFKRFATKEALFARAMAPELEMPDVLEELPARAGQGTVKGNLAAAADALVPFFRELIPLAMTQWSHHGEQRSLGVPPPVRAIKLLAAYLDAEQRKGRVRRGDPEVAARVFLGALYHHASLELLGFDKQLPMKAPVFTRGLVDLLLRGLEPR